MVPVAACGSADDGGSATPSPSFPVTVTRQGGVAGVDEKVVVQQDGSATAVTRTGQSSCTVDAATVTALGEAAGGASGTATTTPAHPDDLVVVLSSPGGSVRLDDAELSGSAEAVRLLLDDLAKPAAERTVCR
jgi:hypothetical protein